MRCWGLLYNENESNERVLYVSNISSNLWFKVSPTLQREGGRGREFIKNGIPGSQGVGMSDAKCPLSR